MTRAHVRIALALGALALPPAGASAQTVFNGDPVDPGTGAPYPVMPGLPLLLPGADEEFGTADDVVDTGITGDVDLVVRIGAITAATVPPPAGAPGGPPLVSGVAGGGIAGPGAETAFTVMASDGTGSPPYGNVLTSADLDARPVTVFAFGDLDDDGVIGPTNADGASDNALEEQEATAFVGRQVGSFAAGRVQGSLGVHVAAPASVGGLRVSLSAGAYTGADPAALFSDGTPLFTLWPYFPPLDPGRVIGNGNVPPPDPDLPSELKFEIGRNYLPAPDHPVLGTPFAVPLDGSEPSTDQLIVVSGPASGARLFDQVDPASFRATARVWLRPAPDPSGTQRTLVLPVDRLGIPADGGASQRTVRLLPVDLLGNVADPDPGGFAVELVASGGAQIVFPDFDSDPLFESVLLSTAAGLEIVLDDPGIAGQGRIDMLQGSRVLGSVPIAFGAATDSDTDGVADDGSLSGLAADLACTSGDVGAGFPCDDNCPVVINPGQDDGDRNGLGNCCDGTCVADPIEAGCGECAIPDQPASVSLDTGILKATRRPGEPFGKLVVRGSFTLGPGATIQPDVETVVLSVLQGGVVRYTGVLDALFEGARSGKPRYRYVDRTASVDGVRRAVLVVRNGDEVRARWRADGPGIVALTAGSVSVSLTVGDDEFASPLACTENRRRVRCTLVSP